MKDIIIRIKNDYFDPAVTLDLNKGKKAAFLYGTNGSGKTTISRALSSLKDSDSDFEGEISFVDSNNNPIILSENDLKRLFIFNEKFVDKNIKEKLTGINNIVILGENVDVDNKIEELKARNNQLESEISSINLEKYITKKDPNCIDDLRNGIVKVLKETYAERGRKIEGRLNKIPATDSTIDVIRNYKNSNDLLSSEKQFNEQLALLDKMRGKEVKLDNLRLNTFVKSEQYIVDLLNFYEDVKLKESINKRFLESADKFGYDLYGLVKNDVDSLDYCPLCLRTFDDESRNNLKLIINEIFDQRAQEISDLIDTVLYNLVEVESIDKNTAYSSEIDNILIANLNHAILSYNSVIKEYRMALKQKLTSIKKRMDFHPLGLENKKKEVELVLQSFNKGINDYNKAIDDFNDNKLLLKKLNAEITYREIESQLKSLDKLIVAQKNDTEAVNKANHEIEENKKIIRDLEQKKRNTKIAINNINRNLRLIYNDRNRLKISASEINPAEYVIWSRNKKVQPKKLSAGERNAIALCYFYESLKSNREEASFATDNNIIILDDPVTSLDYDAKVGIYSFLGKIIDELELPSNLSNSVLIILSHNYEIVQKLLTKFQKSSEKPYVAKLKRDKTLEDIIKPQQYSNYADLLYNIFQFAKGDDISDGESILPIARKTLEAYSTFNYRDGMSNVFKNDRVLAQIGDKEAVSYFKNEHFNFLLNPGSHEQYQTNLIPDIIEEPFNVDTTQSLLKDILLFVYLTNKEHIICNLEKASLVSADELERIFDGWLSQASWKGT